MSTIKIKKPDDYKSHFVVNDPHPMLIINLQDSIWQKSVQIGHEGESVKVTDEGEYLLIEIL